MDKVLAAELASGGDEDVDEDTDEDECGVEIGRGVNICFESDGIGRKIAGGEERDEIAQYRSDWHSDNGLEQQLFGIGTQDVAAAIPHDAQQDEFVLSGEQRNSRDRVERRDTKHDRKTDENDDIEVEHAGELFNTCLFLGATAD